MLPSPPASLQRHSGRQPTIEEPPLRARQGGGNRKVRNEKDERRNPMIRAAQTVAILGM